MAASPSLRKGDFAEFQRQAEASLTLRQSGNIMLVDRDMRQLVNTWAPFGTPLEKAAAFWREFDPDSRWAAEAATALKLAHAKG